MGDATPTTPVKLPPPLAPWWTERRLRWAALVACAAGGFVLGMVVGLVGGR